MSVPACVDHALALEDLSLAANAPSNRKPPTVEAREGREENCGLHAPTSESHSLARASHALVSGCLEGMRLVSMEVEDEGGQGGEERVELHLEE